MILKYRVLLNRCHFFGFHVSLTLVAHQNVKKMTHKMTFWHMKCHFDAPNALLTYFLTCLTHGNIFDIPKHILTRQINFWNLRCKKGRLDVFLIQKWHFKCQNMVLCAKMPICLTFHFFRHFFLFWCMNNGFDAQNTKMMHAT